MWPLVRSYLPPPSASVVEIGCGHLGGFVPMLSENGYDALGIDPRAPVGDCYEQNEFERSELAGELDAIIACTSLHHVADPDQVLDQVAAALMPAGRMIVIEWDWEGFDEASAQWAFERLGAPDADSWIARRRRDWLASGQAWGDYFPGWAKQHGLQSARGLVRALDERFERVAYSRGPYFFAELSGASEHDELSAIEAGLIQPARIDYVGQTLSDGSDPNRSATLPP